MSVTMPSSTAWSRASCWAFEKRWTSSMKRTVRRPVCARRSRARSMTLRTSATPELTADSSSYDGARLRGDQAGHGRLAGAGRAEEDHRAEGAGLDRHPQRAAPSPSRWSCPTTSLRCVGAACAPPAERSPRDRPSGWRRRDPHVPCLDSTQPVAASPPSLRPAKIGQNRCTGG